MSIEDSVSCTWTVSFFYVCMLVSVKSTPSIDVGPISSSITLVYGSESTTSIYLRCQVSNLGNDHRVAWFKNTKIQISENDVVFQNDATDLQRYNIDGMYNLQIYPFSSIHAFKDSGNYECHILDADDKVVIKSNILSVTINVTPGYQYPICRQFIDELFYQGNESMYFTGDNVTLQCLSDPGKPAVVLQWFRNDDSTSLNTWVGSNTDLFVYPKNSYTLDLSAGETGTTFTCQLSQPGQMARHCTIGPITIYDEPTINIYPEITRVNSMDSIATFTCIANTSTSGPSVDNYKWNMENVRNGIENALFQVDYVSGNKTINLTRFRRTDNGEYNVTCIVDYGFSSRHASASLVINIESLSTTNSQAESTISMSTISMSTSQIGVSPITMSMQTTTQKQKPRATSLNSEHTKTRATLTSPSRSTDASVIIIVSTVGGLGLLLILTIAILALCISKYRKANQQTRNSEIVLNQHIEVNVIAHPSQENQTLHLRENIAYDSVDDRSEGKNIYLEDNIAYESTQNTRNDEIADNGRQVQTLQSLENIAYESEDDHGQDQGPYSRDNIAYEGVDGLDNNRSSTFPENSACIGTDDPENRQTSHLLENEAYESVDNHGKDQTTHSCENIAYESADDMRNSRNSNFRENVPFEGAGIQGNDRTHLVDNVAYESVDTHSEDQTLNLRDNETHEVADGFGDDRNANLRDNIAYESDDNISAKDTAYAEGNLYETLEKKVRPTPDGNKGECDVNKNVDRPVGSNNNSGQLREVGGQESASGRQLTTDRSSIAGNTTNKTLDEMYAKPNKRRVNTLDT